MTPPARIAAAIAILDAWLAGQPLEAAYTGWSRRARYAGSGDRAAVRDLIYDAARRRRSHAVRGGAETGRGLMIGALREAGTDVPGIFTGEGHAPPPLTAEELVRGRAPTRIEALDIPDWLVAPMEATFGPRTEALLHVLRDRAPVHLRVNLAAVTRADAVALLAGEGIAAEPHPQVATALVVTDGARRLARSRLLAEGMAELQDASSQAVVARLCAEPPRRVLDFCAGAGGKALAFADLSDAAIVAHDISAERMAALPERAARAGAEIRLATGAALKAEAPFDLVLCDAPCSGSGTWRRDPEAKWRLTPARLAALIETQAEVLAAAAPRVAPGGRLAYATCSVLAAENEAQADSAAAALAGWAEVDRHRIDPGPLGDGFFLAVFRAPS